MNTIKYLLLLLIFPVALSAQQEITMTMDECIDMAANQSLAAFLNKNTYLVSYWDYRSYKASRLPSLHLNTMPLAYDKGISQEWDKDTKSNLPTYSETLNSTASLKIEQTVELTGGTFSVESSNKYLGGDNSFTSTPISVHFTQDLSGYNELKWNSKIDPALYESAKREYIEDREALSMEAITNFFSLISSQIKLDIANRNYTNAQELYRIGKGRFEVGTITQDEVLTLELDLYNSRLNEIKAEQSLLRARINLNIFLNIDKNTIINCIIPEKVPNIEIAIDDAVDKAMRNNSKLSDLYIRELQKEKSVSQTKADNRFSSTIDVSYGLNGNNTEFINSYQNLGQQQLVNLSFNVPLVDWGEGKGAIAVAKSSLEVERIKIKQETIAFEQEVSVNVLEFNLQKSQVENSAKADTIAQKGYDISYEIFKLGKLDVIKLNQARNDQELAREAYITSLSDYWSYWYLIRQQTLYDFEKGTTLTEDFDALINE